VRLWQKKLRAAEPWAKRICLALLFLCPVSCRDERAVLVLPAGSDDAGFGDAPSENGVRVVVNVNAVIREISPLIYGFHLPDGPSIEAVDYLALRPTLLRVPGFRPVTYNWEINATNGGSSWCNENGQASGPAEPLGFVAAAAETASKLGATLAVTVPMSDFVSADTNGGSGPPGCSGDVRKTPNHLMTRFVSNVPAASAALGASPDLVDGRVYQDHMVTWLRRKYPSLPVVFELDRYPDVRTSFHPELFSQPIGYDELCTRSVRFASAIKTTWPESVIVGPIVSGWSGLVALGPVTERGAKGDFFAYYLRCFENTKPKGHLLNALAFSWGSGASAGGESVGGSGTSDAVVKARVQAPRSLWDPTFIEDSSAGQSEGALRLLPRLSEVIEKVDPDVGVDINEWSFGGTDHPSGAVAAADALGIFGKLGVRMAVLRWHQEPQRFSLAALRMFRNFDGNGTAFASTAVQVSSSNAEFVTAYASKDRDGGVYVVVINKDQADRSVQLSVPDISSTTVWRVFRIDPKSAKPVRGADVAGRTTPLVFPPLSVNLLYAPKP